MDVKKALKENWPYIYFLALTIVVFAGFIFSNKMLFGSDTMEAGIFFRSFYADFVRTYHRIPLWNPYIYGGLPFVDAMHGDTFYPLAALQFILPLFKALGYKLVITVFLAGVFTYLYLRKMGMAKWASSFGGTVYMLSGFLVSLVYAGQDGRMYVTSLLPLLLYTMEIGFHRKNLLWWWPFAVAFAILVMANHPQFSYFAMWCVGAYFVFRLIFELKENKTGSQRWIPIPGFFLAMFLGLCLSLVAIWPNQDYVRKYSPRAEGGKGYDYAASWSLHAEEAVSQIIPGFAGYSSMQGHPGLNAEPTYWGKNYFKINTETAGLMALILAMLGLFIYRDRFSWFFVGTAIFSMLYALGKAGVIFKLIFYTVPFVNQFRAPSTIMFLFCFAATFLAARTVDQLEKARKITNHKNLLKGLIIAGGLYLLGAILVAIGGLNVMKIYTSIFYSSIEPGQISNLESNLPHIIGGLIEGALFLFACALLFWGTILHKISFKTAAIAFLAMAVVDGWILTDMRFIQPVDPTPYFTKPPIVKILDKDKQAYRVFAMSQTLSNQNELAQYGIDEVAGYHGNQLRWYDNFLGGNSLSSFFTYKNGQAQGFSPNFSKIMSMVNGKYFIWNQKFTPPGFELLGTSPDGINIYHNTSNLPRARIVYGYDVVPNPDNAVSTFMAPAYDYVNRIVIDRAPKSQIAPPTSASGDTVIMLDGPADQIKFRANLAASGFVAIQDNWYPYWKAFEGKTEIPIYRTDYTFMAVELPAGTHEIVLQVENPKYILGKNVTIVSWILLVMGLGVGVVISQRNKVQA
jgi:hypothetical protein